MTTILIWLGSGFAFAVGAVCCGILLTVKKMEKSNSDQRELQVKSLEALVERNALGYDQLAMLRRIADALDIANQEG